MKHYLYHLLTDPLGMFDSAVRDLFLFCAVLGGVGFFIFIVILIDLVRKDRRDASK